MKFLSVLFLVCLLINGVWAQENGAIVSGKLEVLGKVISNTPIRLVDYQDSTKQFESETDEAGNYSFQNVPDGLYWLVFKDRGGVENKESVFVRNGEQESRLRPSVTRLTLFGEVTVISAGTTQTDGEISKTVNVIDAQEISDRNEFSLADSLRTVPGFRVQQLGGFGKTASIKTRGLRNQDTAVLIDGIRFRDPASITGDASAFLSDFVFSNTNRVEVLRGSGSSLYGTNAIGGVLDVQTRPATNELHGSFFGEAGGLGLKRLRGDFNGPLIKDKLFFSFGGARTVFSDGIDREDDANNTTFTGRLDFQPSDTTTISGRFYFSDAFVRLNSSPDTLGSLPASNSQIIRARPLSIAALNNYASGLPVTNAGGANFIPDTNDPDNFQRSDFFSGQIALTQIISPQIIFSASYQGLKTSRQNENDGLGVGFQPFGGAQTSVFDGQIHTLNTNLKWTPAPFNLVTIGYEYELEKYGNDGLTADSSGNFTARASQRSHTFYAQDLLGFFENRLQLIGGFRAQWFSLRDPVLSAVNAPYQNLTLENPPTAYTVDGSVSYYFTSTGTKIRGHVGNGYRVPSLYERFGTFYSSFSQDFTALGDPFLKPERSVAFDFGVDQTLFRNRALLSATYFYTGLTETIGYANAVPAIGDTPRPFGGYFNTDGGLARGLELSGDFRPTGSTRVFTSYTYTNSDQRTPQVAGTGILRTLGIPDHQFSLVATQQIKRLTLNLDFAATSDYLAPIFSNTTFSTYVYRFSGNRKADLTGSYQIPLTRENVRLRLFGTVENLFGFDYYENGFRTAGRTARGGLGISF